MRLFRRMDGRYYAIAEAHRDLLGDVVIMTLHGSDHSRRGGVHTYPDSATTLDALVKTRLHHGYAEVLSDGAVAVTIDGDTEAAAMAHLRDALELYVEDSGMCLDRLPARSYRLEQRVIRSDHS